MTQKNTNEWQAKIYFEETGIFEVVATAAAPDGSIIEDSVEIEVISPDCFPQPSKEMNLTDYRLNGG
ncbi:MAG: hypothetical protein J6C64_03385 [Lachnospiraceae bacterium]|nr:hypothetical protein [Lachnospiraceae bacterium]